MKIMFSAFTAPASTMGAVTRMMALARKFTNEGHSVNFCASGETAGHLRDKGFTVHELPESTIFGLPRSISNLLAKQSYTSKIPAREGRSYGNLWLVLYFSGHSNRRYLLESVRMQKEACDKFGADLIITELDPAAYICAYLSNIPIAATYAAIAKKAENSYFWRKTENSANYVIRHFRETTHVPLKDIIYGDNLFKIIPSIPELDQTPADQNTCYCGNILEPIKDDSTEFIPEPGKKYIFCYFGTGSISHSLIERELPLALRDRKEIICYMATSSIKEEYQIENVKFVNYINAHKLLPHCILSICHGGLNTITQSLEYGVPVLSFPGPIFERRFNAEMTQNLGVGHLGELSNFNSDWLNKKIDEAELMTDDCRFVQERFREYQGVSTAYSAIIKWITRRPPACETHEELIQKQDFLHSDLSLVN